MLQPKLELKDIFKENKLQVIKKMEQATRKVYFAHGSFIFKLKLIFKKEKYPKFYSNKMKTKDVLKYFKRAFFVTKIETSTIPFVHY